MFWLLLHSNFRSKIVNQISSSSLMLFQEWWIMVWSKNISKMKWIKLVLLKMRKRQQNLQKPCHCIIWKELLPFTAFWMEYQLSFLFASIFLEESRRSFSKKQLIWEELLILKMLQQLHEFLRGVETLDFLCNSQDFPENLSQFLGVSRFPGF